MLIHTICISIPIVPLISLHIEMREDVTESVIQKTCRFFFYCLA